MCLASLAAVCCPWFGIFYFWHVRCGKLWPAGCLYVRVSRCVSYMWSPCVKEQLYLAVFACWLTQVATSVRVLDRLPNRKPKFLTGKHGGTLNMSPRAGDFLYSFTCLSYYYLLGCFHSVAVNWFITKDAFSEQSGEKTCPTNVKCSSAFCPLTPGGHCVSSRFLIICTV